MIFLMVNGQVQLSSHGVLQQSVKLLVCAAVLYEKVIAGSAFIPFLASDIKMQVCRIWRFERSARHQYGQRPCPLTRHQPLKVGGILVEARHISGCIERII